MDIVFPHNNEKKFLDIATMLNTSFYCTYSKREKNGALHLEKVPQRIPKVMVVADARRDARQFIEKGVSLIYNVELSSLKDSLHYRRSGLNQVLCKLAVKKQVVVGFNVGLLMKSSSKERALLLGKMQQNVRLCRKYGVRMLLGSFASSPGDVRAPAELQSIGVVMGMTVVEAKAATNVVFN